MQFTGAFFYLYLLLEFYSIIYCFLPFVYLYFFLRLYVLLFLKHIIGVVYDFFFDSLFLLRLNLFSLHGQVFNLCLFEDIFPSLFLRFKLPLLLVYLNLNIVILNFFPLLMLFLQSLFQLRNVALHIFGEGARWRSLWIWLEKLLVNRAFLNRFPGL